MILEAMLEQKLKEAILPMIDETTTQVICSRETPEDELVTEDDEKTHIVAIGTSFRQHDSFSVSPINVGAVITVVTRQELDPTGAGHEELIEKIADKLSYWHKFVQSMCDALTTEKFLCSELRMDGGTGRIQDKANSIWNETISFTVAGAQIF